MQLRYYLNRVKKLLLNKNKEEKYGWSGNYSSWNEVNKLCKGYDDSLIFEKVKSASLAVKNGEALFERDSVLFYEDDYSEDFLKIIEELKKQNNELNILDFGGALGSLYFQYKPKFGGFNKISWNIIEQGHFVDFGKREIENNELKFYHTISECLANNAKIDMVILSSVISYFEKPYDLLKEIMSFKFKYLLIDKNIFCKHHDDILTLQIVPPSIYTASYPCWVLNENKLIKFVSEYYQLQSEYAPYGDLEVVIDDKTAYFKALLFKLK